MEATIARHTFRSIVIAVAALVALTTAAFAQGDSLRGVALVIGQSNYAHIPALPNPGNDARAIVKLLSDLGFDARNASDRDSKKLRRDLERFVEDADGADVALLYYSGHGIEAGGENWLVPVDADVSSLAAADDDLVSLSSVMDELEAVVPVTIVLLDACRTNPFPAGAVVRRSPGDAGAPVGTGGLTPVRGAAALGAGKPGKGDLGAVIGFAAEPGRPALDGAPGANSPYAAALLRHLGAMEGLEFGQVMRMVTEEVYLDTRTKQRPWVNESLRRLLYFGVPQVQPTGDDGLITGERRQLLLTISDLPDFNRAKVETVAAKDGVPLDALYGVLRALGTANIPEDPVELEKILDAQAVRLGRMIAERNALRTDDPEILRLAAAADRAIGQGAIVTARQFLDQAVKRVEATGAEVDAAEEAVRQKRIADAAIYAQRAAAASLAFDYPAAAADYARAFALVERWDDRLGWNYKNLEAEALLAQGDARGDLAALDGAIEAYRRLLAYIPYGEQTVGWATTRSNMAVALWTMGRHRTDTRALEEAASMFREAMAVLEREGRTAHLASAQNNLGNVLLLAERSGDPRRSEEAVAAFQAALARRERASLPLDWAATQNSIGLALFDAGDRTGSVDLLRQSEAAFRLALQEYTRERTPVEWAMATGNLGITLDALAQAAGDLATFRQAADAFRSTLAVRTRERLPLRWADSKVNLAGTLQSIAKLEQGTDGLDEAEAALRDALTVHTRELAPLDWASIQNTLGAVLQLAGQRSGDAGLLAQSADAYRAAMQESTEACVPLDFAMLNFNLGNSLQLAGQLKNDPAVLRQAVDAYEAALRHYTYEHTPRQWALANVYMGAALQSLAAHENPIATYERAVELRRAALRVLTRDNAALDWANAQQGLGICLMNLANFDRRPALLPEALAAFEATEQVFTREALPLQWAFAEITSATCTGRWRATAAAGPSTRWRSRGSRAPDRPSSRTATSRWGRSSTPRSPS